MEQVGSGVLYEEDGETFVLTAAHVADFLGLGTCVLAVRGAEGQAKPVPLLTTSYTSSGMPRNGNRSDDREDVAAILVPAEADAQLRTQCTPATWSDIGLEHDVRADDGISVVGFPLAESRTDHDGHISFQVLPSATGWGTPSRKLLRAFGTRALYPVHARSPAKMGRSDPARSVPHAVGYSGSGVWLHQRGVPDFRRTWSEAQIRLLGVVHKWKPDSDCLVATRVSEAVQYARDVARHVRTRRAGMARG